MINICLCGQMSYSILFTVGKFAIAKCTKCGQVRTIASNNALHKQYYSKEDIQVYLENENKFRDIFKRIVSFIRKYKNKGRLLEIGAGVGLLVDEANHSGFTARGIEPSLEAVKAAKKFFDVHLEQKLFNKSDIKIQEDVVILNHVLEHIAEPRQMIRDVTQILNKRGLLVIGVPNFENFISWIKKGKWQSLIPDQHVWHFSQKTLDNLILSFGYKKIEQLTDNHDRNIHPWWKRPIYFVIDIISMITGNGEALLVIYKKND